MQSINRRRFLRILGGTATAALLTACAGPAPAPQQEATKPAESKPAPAGSPAAQSAPAAQGTITGTFWFNQPVQQEAFQAIIDRFHKSQSRVKMEVVLVPQTDVPAKLATAIAGGEPPDAVRLGGPALNSLFITNGHAAVLDEFDPQIGSYDWLPGIKQALTRNGKMYAMPVNSGVQSLIYNTELYQKAGLDPAKPPKTLTELLDNAAKVASQGDQIWGHYTTTAPNYQTGSDFFLPILWEFGGNEISEDGKKIAFNTPEGVAALQWYKDLIDKRGMPAKQVNETQMLTDYLTGSVGSMVSYPALVARVAKASFKSASALLPAGPKTQISSLGFGTIMVLDKGKNKQAGWEFAKFIGLDASNDAFWNISFGQLPPRLSYREDPSWKKYEQENPLVPAYVEGQKSARLAYFGPGAQEMGTELGKAVEAVVFGKKTPQQAMEEAASASQTALDRELKKSG